MSRINVKNKKAKRVENEQVMQFISGYCEREDPQSMDEIQGDFQLTALTPLLNSLLSSNPSSRILDIGCGNAVLLSKLVDINCFEKYPEIKYLGFDITPTISDAFQTVVQLRLTSRATIISLEEEDWSKFIVDPSIIVIRNVFHELSICDASKLIYTICTSLPQNSIMLLQDMTTLPVAEKGNAGWIGSHLKKIFENCGLNIVPTYDKSKRGINVFLLEGKRKNKCKIEESEIYNLLIKARMSQLDTLYSVYEKTHEAPENQLKLLWIKHDISAINYQLNKCGEKLKNKLSDKDTLISSFRLALLSYSESDFEKTVQNYSYPTIKSFQNRGKQMDAIDDFFLSDKSIFILKAGPFMGKRTVVWWTLDQKLRHERLPIYIDLNEGTNIVTILEEIIIQLGVNKYVDVEILSALKDLPLEDLKKDIKECFISIAKKIILILDSVERCTDSQGLIENQDVAWIIEYWSGLDKAKIILETRERITSVPLERCELHNMGTFPRNPINEYAHTIRMLNDLVPVPYRIKNNDFGGYPEELLQSLDNHPYFTYIAGTIIRSNLDPKCLEDTEFILNLKNKLYESLYSNFNLCEDEWNLILILKLVRNSFPLKLIDLIAQNSKLKNTLLEKGFLIENSQGLFRILGILDGLSQRKHEVKKDIKEKNDHQTLAGAFKTLYEIDSNPLYYRESYYHSALSGNMIYSAYSIPELSSCADSWYKSKKYEDALWAYSKIKEKRPLYQKENMRIASCLIRTKKMDEGKLIFTELIRKYPEWLGVRYSYIDSLLAIGNHATSALKIAEKIPDSEKYERKHIRLARCYKELNNRLKAYEEYENVILQSNNSEVWSVIKEMTSYARDNGDNDKEIEWLDHAWDKLKIKTNEVRVELGSFYERADELEKAEYYLEKAYHNAQCNSFNILPYVKILCRLDKINEAEKVLNETDYCAFPRPVYQYAKVVYLKAIKEFETCEKILADLINDESVETDVHKYGQWADLYLSWCQSLKGWELSKKAEIGLKYVEEILAKKNVPAMMACLELAKIKDNSDLKTRLKQTILSVNESLELY